MLIILIFFLFVCYFGKLQENYSSGQKAKADFKQKQVLYGSQCWDY